MKKIQVARSISIIVLMIMGAFVFQAKAQSTERKSDTIPQQHPPLHKGEDTVVQPPIYMDTALRIRNLNPYFTLHVDSTLTYKFEINKEENKYFWYLKNSPVGLKINKDNGMLTFKAEKSFFLSGKLRYDFEYKVNIGVQNLNRPDERIDTGFTLVFYNTEIIPSRVKPSVSNVLYIDEGDTVNFKVMCETGSFPIESITFLSNTPLRNHSMVRHCDDDFIWTPPFDFVKDNEKEKEKTVILSFVGTSKFMVRDTAVVRIVVRDALNYPLAVQEFNLTRKNINNYVLQLKYTFLQMDKKIKKTKNTRTSFDFTSATSALTGTVLNSSSDPNTQKIGKNLPSIGVAMVPMKEAVSPQKMVDQNQASAVRGAIKRLEYMLSDNNLLGDRDPEISRKTQKLKDELKQVQVQLVDVPLDVAGRLSEEELNEYFNSPKVNKKYRLKKK
jgi:hypothetical protein